MVIEFKYVFIVLWLLFISALVIHQAFTNAPLHRKWDWKNTHERLLVASMTCWILIFFAKGYDWAITI